MTQRLPAFIISFGACNYKPIVCCKKNGWLARFRSELAAHRGSGVYTPFNLNAGSDGKLQSCDNSSSEGEKNWGHEKLKFRIRK
jgi:hypothetical protein